MFWKKIEELLNRKVRSTSMMENETRGDDFFEMVPLRWYHPVWRGERKFFPFEINSELCPSEVITLEYVTPGDFFGGFWVKKPSFVAHTGEGFQAFEANEKSFFLLARNIYVSVYDNILAEYESAYRFDPYWPENIPVMPSYPRLLPDLEHKRKLVKAERELMELKKRLLLTVGYRVIEIEDGDVIEIEG